MIPFLDILCSLIGVLVLIIVVLCVAQMQKINGRTPQEMERAQDALKLKKQQVQNEQITKELKEPLANLEKLKNEVKQKQEDVAKVRKLVDSSTTDLEKNKEDAEKLKKELEAIKTEITGLVGEKPPLKEEIARLQAEIEKRNPPVNTAPNVIVQPGGSGMAKGSKVFFVDASARQLTFYWDEKTKTTISSSPEVVSTDEGFNAFLKAVAADPQNKILFLLRGDGLPAYNVGAGWAQATYGFGTERIGKLPIPGQGAIDFTMFKQYLGALPPPKGTETSATPKK